MEEIGVISRDWAGLEELPVEIVVGVVLASGASQPGTRLTPNYT